MGTCLQNKYIKWPHTACPALYISPEHPRAQMWFTCGWAHAPTSDVVHTNVFFQINMGPRSFLRPGLCQTSCNEPFYVYFCVFFCHRPCLLLFYRRRLHRYFAVKLRKPSPDYKPSPEFPSAWRWVENDWFLIFGGTYPLRVDTPGWEKKMKH